MSGVEACKCCKQAANVAAGNLAQNVLAILSSFLDPAWTASPEPGAEPDLALTAGFTVDSAGVRLLQEVKAVPRNSPSSPGAAGGAGAVLLLTWETLTTLATNEAVMAAVAALSDALPPLVATARKLGERSCETCVESKLWTQSKPQAREVAIIRRRLG